MAEKKLYLEDMLRVNDPIQPQLKPRESRIFLKFFVSHGLLRWELPQNIINIIVN